VVRAGWVRPRAHCCVVVVAVKMGENTREREETWRACRDAAITLLLSQSGWVRARVKVRVCHHTVVIAEEGGRDEGVSCHVVVVVSEARASQRCHRIVVIVVGEVRCLDGIVARERHRRVVVVVVGEAMASW
jgi:hypothetical protein